MNIYPEALPGKGGRQVRTTPFLKVKKRKVSFNNFQKIGTRRMQVVSHRDWAIFSTSVT